MLDADLYAQLVSALLPPARPSIAEWSEAHMRLAPEMSAEPGPLKLNTAQRGIAAALDDPRCHTVVCMLPAQYGKSALLEAALFTRIATDPGPMLYVHPTEAKAKDWVRSRIDPLIAANPNIRRLIGQDRTRKTKGGAGGDGLLFKSFPGGSIAIGSSNKPEDLAAKSIRDLFLDEVDRFARSSGREGDPLQLALKRTRRFKNRRVVMASTPTLAGASRIAEWFERGSKERFNIACPDCGCLQAPTIDQLKWDAGKPHTAILECSECAHRITENVRQHLIEKGEWITTAIEPEPGIRSFHTTALTSKYVTLAEVATEFEAAKTINEQKTFANLTLAEPFDASADVVADPADLEARAVPVLSPYPADVQYITAGVDLQGNRAEVLFLGNCPKRRIVLDYVVVPGDPTGTELWTRLDATLRTTFRRADGAVLPVQATFLDSGFSTHTVYSFALKTPRVHPVKGISGFSREIIKPGKKISGSNRHVLGLAVDELKLFAAKSLLIPEGDDGHVVLPSHVGSEFFAGLASERLEFVFNKSGHFDRKWVKQPETANEPFDALGYALAASLIVKRPMRAANAPKPTSANLTNLAHVANQITMGGLPASNGGR